MMEILKFSDKDQRDQVFSRLRGSELPNERAVVRFSEVEPDMLTEEEFKLDEKGRVAWLTYWYLAYPEAEGYIRSAQVFRGREVIPNLKEAEA